MRREGELFAKIRSFRFTLKRLCVDLAGNNMNQSVEALEGVLGDLTPDAVQIEIRITDQAAHRGKRLAAAG
jgi:hypothetical protein